MNNQPMPYCPHCECASCRQIRVAQAQPMGQWVR